MSTSNITTLEDFLSLLRILKGYNQIVRDSLLNHPETQELTEAMDFLEKDINKRLKRILGGLTS